MVKSANTNCNGTRSASQNVPLKRRPRTGGKTRVPEVAAVAGVAELTESFLGEVTRGFEAKMRGGFSDMTNEIPPRISTRRSPNTPALIALRNCRGLLRSLPGIIVEIAPEPL